MRLENVFRVPLTTAFHLAINDPFSQNPHQLSALQTWKTTPTLIPSRPRFIECCPSSNSTISACSRCSCFFTSEPPRPDSTFTFSDVYMAGIAGTRASVHSNCEAVINTASQMPQILVSLAIASAMAGCHRTRNRNQSTTTDAFKQIKTRPETVSSRNSQPASQPASAAEPVPPHNGQHPTLYYTTIHSTPGRLPLSHRTTQDERQSFLRALIRMPTP